jgi:hypothetical protein
VLLFRFCFAIDSSGARLQRHRVMFFTSIIGTVKYKPQRLTTAALPSTPIDIDNSQSQLQFQKQVAD